LRKRNRKTHKNTETKKSLGIILELTDEETMKRKKRETFVYRQESEPHEGVGKS
jgi:hypothetical protein